MLDTEEACQQQEWQSAAGALHVKQSRSEHRSGPSQLDGRVACCHCRLLEVPSMSLQIHTNESYAAQTRSRTVWRACGKERLTCLNLDTPSF